MLGIIVFLVALVAMFAWFIYLFAKDPANLFKRDERAQRRRDFGRDVRSDGSILTPIDACLPEPVASEGFTPGGGDFGGAGSSGDWGNAGGDSGADGGDSSD
jgi:hypothetical protein